MINHREFLLLTSFAAVSACTRPSNGLEAASASRTMSYQECVTSITCSAEGLVSIQEINGIKMESLQFDGGRCVAVSFPKALFRKSSRPRRMKVEGRVYKGHHDPNFLLLKINGRSISYPPCGETYIFVK
jgi:hypothetical protein